MSEERIRVFASKQAAEEFPLFGGLAQVRQDPSIRAVFKTFNRRHYIALDAEQAKNIGLPTLQNDLGLLGRWGVYDSPAAVAYVTGYNMLLRAQQLKDTGHRFVLPSIRNGQLLPAAATDPLPESLRDKQFVDIDEPLPYHLTRRLAAKYKPGTLIKLPTFDGEKSGLIEVEVLVPLGQAEDRFPGVFVEYTPVANSERSIGQVAGGGAHRLIRPQPGKRRLGGPRQMLG